TGKGSEDIRAFTRRLFRFVESRYGDQKRPRQLRSGYMTHSGVFVGLERLQLAALPGLEEIHKTPVALRREFVREFLSKFEQSGDAFHTMMNALSTNRPISTFLRRYRALFEDRADARYRSVI